MLTYVIKNLETLLQLLQNKNSNKVIVLPVKITNPGYTHYSKGKQGCK